MTKFVALCEYDGSNYSGFQFQDNARSIQHEVEQAIASFAELNSRVSCAGRTDTGVHALGQVIDFNVASYPEDIDWALALNSKLPNDISIKRCQQAPEDFHARFSALDRTYAYIIYNSSKRPALMNKNICYVRDKINRELLEKELKSIMGKHDFSAFRSSRCSAKNSIKEITEANLYTINKIHILEITANAFLHNMIRIIVGTLIDICTASSKHLSSITQVLDSKIRSNAGKTASPHGLYLLGARYKEIDRFKVPILSLINHFNYD